MGTIASCQAAIGYRYAGERPGCQNCAQARFTPEGERGPYARARHECARYGFYTTPLSICDQHEDNRKEGGAV